ncbi:IQ domain-containing protein H-like isoform X2 [Pogoniulus pusillus]|uniref:IQ domain-containing protein H-like isoform X2 n=1 Tax=Pogoniulus pusillus TaxID=488313 RepID=UPI0030B94C47
MLTEELLVFISSTHGEANHLILRLKRVLRPREPATSYHLQRGIVPQRDSQVQEDLHKLKVKNNSTKGNVQVMDISDLKTAFEGTELGLRKHAENYLNAINRQVLTVSSADNKEVHSKEPSKWELHCGASQKQLILPRVHVEPRTVQAYRKSSLRVSQGPQVEMDMKVMLDPEITNYKAVLKHNNYDTRLPLITQKKTAPVNLSDLTASQYADSALPLLEEDTTKGESQKALVSAVVTRCMLLKQCHLLFAADNCQSNSLAPQNLEGLQRVEINSRLLILCGI